jgi:class 3 adenylate cyclase
MPLPTGVLTLLFSDIEGSTRLLERLGDDYSDVLDEHRRIVRRAITEHDGARSTPRATGSSWCLAVQPTRCAQPSPCSDTMHR